MRSRSSWEIQSRSGTALAPKQRSSDFTVGRAVEAAIEGAQGEDESVSPRLGKRRRVGARTAAVERAPKAQRSGHSDFKEPIERQKNRSRICAAAVQMHAHLGAEALDDIVVTFSGQYGIKRQRLGLELLDAQALAAVGSGQ